jgi:thioesterase domain-containing protein
MPANSSTSILEKHLHEHIPLSKAMHAKVECASLESVVLSAPLEPNINHRETAFGGSTSALAILSAWSLVHLRLQPEHPQCRIVIHRNTMEYRLPIQGRFSATSRLAQPEIWDRFVQLLSRKGMARVRVNAVVESEQQIVGEFNGEFVALLAQ